MQSGGHTTKRDDAFTVAELVFSAAILLMIVSSSIAGLMFAARSNLLTLQNSEATSLANQQIEYIRNLADFADVAPMVSTGGLPAGKIATPRQVGKYTIATTVAWGESDPNVVYARTPFKDVTVVVSWEDPSPGSVTLDTRVAGKDTEGLYNRGTITLTIKDEATPAQPVAGVTVDMTDYADHSYEVVTSASGTVRFPSVPSGQVTLVASKPGYLITNIPTTYNCVANQINDVGVATAKKLRSGVITVLAPSSVPVPVGSVVSLAGGGTTPAAQVTGAGGTTTFANLLISSGYTVSVTPPSACYNTVVSAGVLAISTADSTPLTITLPPNSVKPATLYVQSNTAGAVYVWNAAGTAYPSAGNNKVTLSKSGSLYKGAAFAITNKDHVPAKYYLTKTSTAPATPSSTVLSLDITAGGTPYPSTSPLSVN